MARDSLAPPFDRAAWIRAGIVSFVLVLPMIIAWMFLGHMREPPKVAASSARPVAASAHAPATPKHTNAHQGARALAGKVVDGDGKGAGNVVVMFLLSNQTDAPFKITTDEDGSFYLDGAPAQAGTLTAKRDGYISASLPVSAGSTDVNGLVLTIRKGEGLKGQGRRRRRQAGRSRHREVRRRQWRERRLDRRRILRPPDRAPKVARRRRPILITARAIP